MIIKKITINEKNANIFLNRIIDQILMEKLPLSINLRDFFLIDDFKVIDSVEEEEILKQNKVLLCDRLLGNSKILYKKGN